MAAVATLMLARPGVMPASAGFPGPGTGVAGEASGAQDERATFTAVSAGGDHTCGVNTDGRLACWGQDWYGEATPPGGTFQQVSAGHGHTCGVKADGGVACWGWDGDGEATPPEGTFQQVSAGYRHTCGLKADGGVTCWGWDGSVQGTPLGATFQRISAGGWHTCGLKTDGEVACWGSDRNEQAAPPAGTFRQVAAGGYHTCALKTDGSVACWGYDEFGQATPPEGTFRQLSAGGEYTCGVKTDGGVACWGKDDHGEATPQEGTFEQISAGWWHVCGLRTEGGVACWGYDDGGRATPPGGIFRQISAGWHTCGLKTSSGVTCWGLIATPPDGTYQQVSAGWAHTCGLKTDSEVVCWGHDHHGEATPPEGTFRQVSAGGAYTCGLRTDSEVLCWGRDDYGQAAPPGGIFQQVSAGGHHACGLRTDGGVACWGYDDYGQATPPGGTFRQVSAGGNHTCGLKTDGEVSCWGLNDDGQAMPPGGTFQQVSAGQLHTCGLQTDGRVACWGHDWSGTVEPPDIAFQEVSAGGWHACGLKTDGGVVCWGAEARGSVGVDGGQQRSGGDYDADDDGLIEVSNLAQLDAVRHDLDGDGVPADEASRVAYYAAFPDAPAGMGCPADGCTGYELANDLDFGTAAGGPGWQPIGDGSNYFTSTFTATFDGNGRTIANLYINRDDAPHVGLFGHTGPGSVIRDVGLVSVSVSNGMPVVEHGAATGGLVGQSGSLIERSYVTGSVESAVLEGASSTGGLVGANHGTITDSCTTATVSGRGNVGGLVGVNFEVITDSYATGAVSGGDGISVGATVGGLVGENGSGGGISHSHATGDVSSDGPGTAGGLVGTNYGDLTAGYATGSVSESFVGGGLVGGNRYRATIAASYATGGVSVWGNRYSAGGLVGKNGHAGFNHEGRIAASYATGRVSGSSHILSIGGLVGDNSLGDITASYWNTETSGQYGSSGGVGLTTAELQSPILTSGIYAAWNLAWWDFGTSWQYPVLKYLGMSVAAQRGGATSETPVELSKSIQPPIAPAYMDWRWETGQGNFRELVTDFTIHNDVGDWSDGHGYYLILLQNEISGAGFYFGVQTDANRRGKGVIFSRWGTDDLANARWSKTGGWYELGRHEGGFIGVRRSYDWGAADYQIRMAPDGLDSDGEWFGLWITDLTTDETTWIGSLKFPLRNGTATFRPDASATIELYGGPRIRPIDTPEWHLDVKPPVGDGIPAVWGFSSYPFDTSENALPNSDVWYDPDEGAVHLRIGGRTKRETPAVDRIDLATAP